MSKMDVKSALARIEEASVNSPLLVMTCAEKNNVMCCFANTLVSRQIVLRNPFNLIGVFHGEMDLDEVTQVIKAKVRADYFSK